MDVKTLFPIFMLEIETGDLDLVNDLDHLCSLVEEFWDILEGDFSFWDKNGYPIKFTESILKKDIRGIMRNNLNEHEKLKSYLFEYARRESVDLINVKKEDLVKLYLTIKKAKREREEGGLL